MSLPDGHSPSLVLAHPTPSEKLTILARTGEPWRKPLSQEAFLRREQQLYKEDLTRDGGLTTWILVDRSEPPDGRTVLASCETILRRALVAYDVPNHGVRVEDVVSYGIASVFCSPELRRRGYAGRLMMELGRLLPTWQGNRPNEPRATSPFSLLYSDVGKEFYSAHGWYPFPSKHIAFPPLDADPQAQRSTLPPSYPLYADAMEERCRIDEDLLRKELSSHHQGNKVRVAVVPTIELMRWHDTREKLTAHEVLGHTPEVKGAIAGEEIARRAWCIWTRLWTHEEGEPPRNSSLTMLRIALEPKKDGDAVDGQAQSADPEDDAALDLLASLMLAAGREAARWQLSEVQIWNPTELVSRAVERAMHESSVGADSPKAKLIDREETICCLKWHGNASVPELPDVLWSDIEWIANEKYAWC